MIEISDRPFGGVSTDATISWTAEKFREALLDLTTQEKSSSFTKELLADRSRAPAPPPAATVQDLVDQEGDGEVD